MFADVDLLGAFIPEVIVWLLVSTAIFVIVDTFLTRSGFYDLFWHSPLARFCLFASLFCFGILVSSPN